MGESELREAEAAAIGSLVRDSGDRITELEVERDKLRFDLQNLREALEKANGAIAELRARLYSIGLLLRQ
jgi:chromosome segregation ATPase